MRGYREVLSEDEAARSYLQLIVVNKSKLRVLIVRRHTRVGAYLGAAQGHAWVSLLRPPRRPLRVPINPGIIRNDN